MQYWQAETPRRLRASSDKQQKMPPSESQRGAGLFGQALVPPAVAQRQKAAVLRCPDLQAVVLSEDHWGRMHRRRRQLHDPG